MDYFEIFLIVSTICVFIMFGIIFLVPTDKQSKKKRKRNKSNNTNHETINIQELEQKIERLQQSIHNYKVGAEKQKKTEAALEKKITLEQAKCQKLQEKLKQERGWQEKELQDSQKKDTLNSDLKKDLKKWQDEYSEEHALNIRLEKELLGLRDEVKRLQEKRRSLEAELASQDTKYQQLRQEMAHLKRDYLQIQKQHDDTTWIAKSEYVKIETELKELKVKLSRLERERPT